MQKQLLSAALMLALGTITVTHQSCNKAEATKTEKKAPVASVEDIPELKKRNAALGAAGEWDKLSANHANMQDRLRKDPNDLDARLRIAEGFMMEARVTGEHGYYYPAALKMIQSALSRNPNPEMKFRALSLGSSVYLSLHQFAKGLEMATTAAQINPQNAQIFGALVDANVELGNYEAAVQMSDRMVSIRPDLRSYSRISYLREIHGEMAGAIEAMEMAVKAGYPGLEQTAWAQLTLGNLYAAQGDLTKAEAMYKRILAERPDYPFAVAALAGVAEKKGKTEEAEKLYKQAIKIIPEVSFYEEMAALYKSTNRPKEAKALTDEILVMLADDEKAGHVMGLTYADVYANLIGDYEKALEYALTEYKQRPANIDVNQTLATLYYQKKDYQKAAAHLAAARKTNSQDPELLNLAGLISLKTGKAQEGQKLLLKSWKTNPYQNHELAAESKKALGQS
jgi:tetratricopeptide (TPR) repeat protein